MIHRFKIGQSVQLTRDNLRTVNEGYFRILALRPSDGNDPLYLVKSESERHQRIVPQSSIKPNAS